jgi:hypothetical protein
MKKEGKSWKDIMTAIGKQSQSQLKEHYKKNLQWQVDGGPPPAADGEGGEGGGGGGGGEGGNRPPEEYSKKNDKTIIQMKGAGKEWKEILEAIGKESVSQLKAHWKNVLQPKVEGGQQGGSGGGGGKASSSVSLIAGLNASKKLT